MIEREDQDDVAVVRLAHGKVNALDLELLTAITETFTELAAGPHRAVVFTGTGRAFCAGVDLWQLLDGGTAYVRQFLPALVTAFETVFNVSKPVVAAVNGHAIAGGCILVSACDHRIMGEQGRIGVTEMLVGVPFPVSALEILKFAVGDRPARTAVHSGATYDPPDALERGFVDELTNSADLLSEAVAAASGLAVSTPAETFALTKRQLRLDVNERLARLRPSEDPLVAQMWETRVTDGWIRAYMEGVTSG